MIASSEKYIEALLKLRDSKRLRKTKFLEMLRAQYAMPKHTITATQLAEIVGFENYNATNLQYGTLGKEISGFLSYDPPKRKMASLSGSGVYLQEMKHLKIRLMAIMNSL